MLKCVSEAPLLCSITTEGCARRSTVSGTVSRPRLLDSSLQYTYAVHPHDESGQARAAGGLCPRILHRSGSEARHRSLAHLPHRPLDQTGLRMAALSVSRARARGHFAITEIADSHPDAR